MASEIVEKLVCHSGHGTDTEHLITRHNKAAIQSFLSISTVYHRNHGYCTLKMMCIEWFFPSKQTLTLDLFVCLQTYLLLNVP